MKSFRTLLFLICMPNLAYAGAWLQPKGEGLAIVQLTRFGSSEYWDENGDLNEQLHFDKWELQPYAEYGLTDKVTVGGTAYLQQVEQGDDSNIGLADPEFFLRTRLWHNDKHVISIQPLIKLPSYFEESGTPRGGSRSVDAELSLLYGGSRKIWSERDYTDIRIGYRTRSRGLGDQVRVDAATGIFLSEHWQVIPAVRGIYGIDSSEAAVFSEDGEQDYSLLKAEATLAYHLAPQQWVFATVFDHVAGLNTGTGRGISLGYTRGF